MKKLKFNKFFKKHKKLKDPIAIALIILAVIGAGIYYVLDNKEVVEYVGGEG